VCSVVKNISKEKKIFASKNRNRSEIQKNIGDKSKSRLERQSVQVSRKVCADKYEEQRLGKDDHETVNERKARSSMGCLLGI